MVAASPERVKRTEDPLQGGEAGLLSRAGPARRGARRGSCRRLPSVGPAPAGAGGIPRPGAVNVGIARGM